MTRQQRAVVAVLGALGVWALLRNGTLSRDSVVLFAVLIPSVILHEVSHGAAALLFGDDTAQRAGRLTLNPVAHVDMFGTIILPAMLVLSGAGAFGYAKPVPVNVGRLRNPRNHGLLVSLVGPTVNVALAVLSAFALRLLLPRDLLLLRFGGRPSLLGELVFDLGLVNVVLATFNLLPIPPLDGSALLERVLPSRYWPTYLSFRQYSMGLVLVVVLLLPGALSKVFDPAFDLWRRLL